MYTEEEVGKLINDIAKVCDSQEEWLIRLVWVGKGNLPNYPWPDVALNLEFSDGSLSTFEVMPFERWFPEIAVKVTLEGDGFYRKISRSDLEIVLKDYISMFGRNPELHLG